MHAVSVHYLILSCWCCGQCGGVRIHDGHGVALADLFFTEGVDMPALLLCTLPTRLWTACHVRGPIRGAVVLALNTGVA